MTGFFASDNRYSGEAKGIIAFLCAICAMFVLSLLTPLQQYGLIPRSLQGISGIVTMPFLHANVSHLLSNLVPLSVLLILLAGSQAHSARVVIMTTLGSGALLWLFGRSALHIGASGLVFALCAFLIMAGLLERRPASIAVATLVVLLYGSTLLSGILPTQSGISWDGHALGALAGFGVASAMFLGQRSSNRR